MTLCSWGCRVLQFLPQASHLHKCPDDVWSRSLALPLAWPQRLRQRAAAGERASGTSQTIGQSAVERRHRSQCPLKLLCKLRSSNAPIGLMKANRAPAVNSLCIRTIHGPSFVSITIQGMYVDYHMCSPDKLARPCPERFERQDNPLDGLSWFMPASNDGHGLGAVELNFNPITFGHCQS